jgi:hypothetical protein
MQRHVTYKFDGPSQLTQLPGSSTYNCDTAEEFDVSLHTEEVFEDARSHFSLDIEEEDAVCPSLRMLTTISETNDSPSP